MSLLLTIFNAFYWSHTQDTQAESADASSIEESVGGGSFGTKAKAINPFGTSAIAIAFAVTLRRRLNEKRERLSEECVVTTPITTDLDENSRNDPDELSDEAIEIFFANFY